MARFASHKSVALVFGVAAVLYCAALGIRLHTRWYELDFSAYYFWAYALRSGLDPYATDLAPLATRLGLATGASTHADYPPTFILCFAPLTLMSPHAAYWVWTGLNLVLLLAAVWVLFKGFGFGACGFVALAAMAILYEPVSENFFWGQAQIVLLLLLVLNFRWARAGKDAGAGLALAMAILLKAYPAIMLLHFVVARRARVVAWTIAGLVAGGLVTLATVGWAAFGFLHPEITTAHVYWNAGLAASATITRIFFAAFGTPLSSGANLARVALIAAAVIWLLALGARATLASERAGRRDAGYGVWVVLAVFLFPITWIHHMVLLLIPFAQTVLAAREGEADGSAPMLALWSYAVSAAMLPLFWIYWLTWYVPLLPVCGVIAQVSGVLAFCAAYRLAIPSRSRA